jgi:hypothetical protein
MYLLSEFSQTELVEMFAYLDNLRLSGATNMFGSAPYLVAAFGLDEEIARDVACTWMRTFSSRVPASERVSRLYAEEASHAH